MTEDMLSDFVKSECARLRGGDEFGGGRSDIEAAEKRLRVAEDHVKEARMNLDWAKHREAFRQFNASALEAALAAKVAP